MAWDGCCNQTARVLAEEKDKQHFIEDVMSKLKHETFPAGYPLATIGVRSVRNPCSLL